MKVTVEAIFCVECGTLLVVHEIPNGYNAYSGQHEVVRIKYCPKCQLKPSPSKEQG